MKFEDIIELINEFDYERNGEQLTIEFLNIMIAYIKQSQNEKSNKLKDEIHRFEKQKEEGV